MDRYVRIKHYTNFKAIWTNKVVFTLIFTGCILSSTISSSIGDHNLFSRGSVHYYNDLYCNG